MSKIPSKNDWSNSMEIVRGSLDEITRPASNTKRGGSRSGSRVSQGGSASSINRHKIGTAGSFEVLPPEIYTDKEYELELEEISGSDYSEDSFGDYTDGTDIELLPHRETPHGNSNNSPQNVMYNTNPWGTSQQLKGTSDGSTKQNHLTLAAVEGNDREDELNMNSDEENDIVKQIRAEITNQVKQEMKDELELYKQEFKTKEPKEEEKHDDLEDLEPKLRDAILKMRKYDRILRKKVVREKEVKRDRIMLQKRLREELHQLNSERKCEGKKELKEVRTNTDKFLALEPPPKHNEGVDLDSIPCASPVFPTQVLDQDVEQRRKDRMKNGQDAGSPSEATTSAPNDNNTEDSNKKSKRKRDKDVTDKGKDFLKRNIELAADAANIIAMTDDEKQRVETLLDDLDSIADIPDDENDQLQENPFQIVVHPGEGYVPAADDMKALQDIDARLKALLPPSDYESIASTPTLQPHTTGYQSLFSRTGLQTTDHIDEYIDTLGERALKETRVNLDYKRRLHDIEGELATLSSAVEQEIESPVLSEEQLQDLLYQCSRTMSKATAETESLASTPRSPRTAREQLYQNPPQLSDDVLQSLLADARQSLSVADTESRLSSYRSSDNSSKATTYVNEDDGTMVESINEDKLRELLQNSRATSRSSQRSTPGMIHDSSCNAHVALLNDYKQNNFNASGNYLAYSSNQGQSQLNNLTNHAQRPPNGKRASAQIVRNSLCESDEETGDSAVDSDLDISTRRNPHPPNNGRRSTSGGKSRTFSHLSKNSNT